MKLKLKSFPFHFKARSDTISLHNPKFVSAVDFILPNVSCGLNPNGTLQRVRYKQCKWGDPKGVSANATRCRLNLEQKHAPEPPTSAGLVEDLSDGNGLEEAQLSQSASEDVQDSLVLKRKLVQASFLWIWWPWFQGVAVRTSYWVACEVQGLFI